MNGFIHILFSTSLQQGLLLLDTIIHPHNFTTLIKNIKPVLQSKHAREVFKSSPPKYQSLSLSKLLFPSIGRGCVRPIIILYETKKKEGASNSLHSFSSYNLHIFERKYES